MSEPTVALLPPMGAATSAMLEEVRTGLARSQKELPPKYFYDVRGSELFERITELPEYYLTRAERALLERWVPEWVAALRPHTLLELGAGSASKTRLILDAMRAAGDGACYAPVDVSADFLAVTAERLRLDYPALEVRPIPADISVAFTLPDGLPRPALYAFLGSTLGNFSATAAARLLGVVRAAMHDGDRFLLGVDLRKDVARLEAAYNDAAGVTAEFNRNLLRVLNRELGADFDVDAFRHRAFYNPEACRIEMHLVAERPLWVRIPGIGVIAFRAGESVRTEISCKYDRAAVEALLAAAGLQLQHWQPDDAGDYALALAAPLP